MDAELQKKIDSWLDQCPFENLNKEIEQLIKENNERELSDRFYKDAEFGTGGIRLEMGAGFNRMNEVVVSKVTQGLANYIIAQGGDKYKKRGVAIAHDSRHNHILYLQETAKVLAANGIHVHIYDEERPTPLLSFAVRYLKTISGIVLTASHNTSEYNGYKVYWEDGGQIVSPHDKNIINEIKKITSYKEVKSMDYNEALENGLINIISNRIFIDYYETLKHQVLRPDLLKKHGNDLKIIYTPLHGASGKTNMEMFKLLGFNNAHAVPEQFKPNGDFPTVKSPNPEESEALTFALDLAKKDNADIVCANDPDGDRMAVGAKDKNGNWVLLNGNQLGSIMAEYIFSQRKEKKILPDNALLVKTIVTTDLQTDIARAYNVKTVDTLTGFKYIGEVIRAEEIAAREGKDHYQYIFGGEESYGYLSSTIVRDKDGSMAIALAAEIAVFAKEQDKTLVDLLNDIYKKYGVYKEALQSITMKGQEGGKKIASIMEKLRQNTPQEMEDNQLVEIRDYKSKEIKDKNGTVIGNLDLPESNVLALYFDNGIKITARPSGTEPKIKFYYSVKISDSENIPVAIEDAENLLRKLQSNFDGFLKD